MPTDSRRLQVPENSEGYRQFVKEDVKSYEARLKKILNEKQLRSDGRTCDEHRKIYMKTGVVTQAKGSAYLELNRTKVLVSVFDPREIPRLSEFTFNGELYCEFKFAPFSCPEHKGHIMDMEEKDLSVIIRRSLEPVVCRFSDLTTEDLSLIMLDFGLFYTYLLKHTSCACDWSEYLKSTSTGIIKPSPASRLTEHEFPNFQVDIYVLLLDNDGSCLSAAITAAGLALADAGIPMYDIISSVSLGVHNDLIFMDPSLEEENFCKTFFEGKTNQMGTISLSYMPTLAQVTEITQIGTVKVDNILKCMELLISKCTQLSSLTSKCLVENVKQHLEEEKS